MPFMQGGLGPGKTGYDIRTAEGAREASDSIASLTSLVGMLIVLPQGLSESLRSMEDVSLLLRGFFILLKTFLQSPARKFVVLSVKVAVAWATGIVRPSRVILAVRIEPDVSLLPGTILKGRCVVERGARIGPNANLTDCHVGKNAVVGTVEAVDATVGDDALVKSFVVIGKGSHVEPGGVIASFDYHTR